MILIPVAGINADENARSNAVQIAANWSDLDHMGPVRCEPEPENEYDKYAVRISYHGMKIGYIPTKYRDELWYACPELFTKPVNGRLYSFGQMDNGQFYAKISINPSV